MCGFLYGHMQFSVGAVCLKLKICLSCAIVLSSVSFFRDAVISVTMKEEGGERYMETMGKRIAEARRRAGLTQLQVGDLLGVSFQAVSSWERDEFLPDTENLIKLSRALKVSVSSLADDSPYAFKTKERIFDEEHMKTFVKVTAKERDLVNTLEALSFAASAHSKQKRKNSDVPYLYHPLNLACHCLAMGIHDDAVIAACLLHDTIEDCGVKEEDLPVDKETREMVRLLSHSKTEEDREKMLNAYYKGLASNPKAALIKCVDRCNNLTSMSWGLARERQLRAIYETEKYVLPLLEVVKKRPEYNDAAWLLRYQIESMLDIYKRLL